MNQEPFDKLKSQIGEQAAIRYERAFDAGLRLMQGKGRPLDPISVFADGLLFEAHMAGHFVGEAAKAVIQGLEHVTGHDKPNASPLAPKGPQFKGK